MVSNEMNRVQKNERQIINKYLGTYPVKLGQLARELGLSIKVASLGAGVSGQIKKEDQSYIIKVNRNEARERQRFTIGHEIAHFLLHRNIIDSSTDGITDNVLYRSGEPERIEFEANRLAADLVMPFRLISQELTENYGGIVTPETIESLAEKFQVSKAAMEIRLTSFEGVAA